MEFKFKSENFLKILKFLLIMICIFLIFKYILGYFTPFIFGYILSSILYPITKILKKRGMSGGFASFITIIFFITIITFIGTTLVSQIVQQGKSFLHNLPTYSEGIKKVIIDFQEFIILNINKLPLFIQNIFYTYYDGIIYFIKDFFQETFKVSSIGIIKVIPNALMIFVIGVVSTFFFLADKENIDSFVYRQLPESFKTNLKIVKDGTFTVIFGYIKAQLIIMAIMASICFLGLTIIRAPYSLFLAFIISIIDALPVLGSGSILIPWGIYQLIIKNYKFAMGLFIIYIIMLITRQFTEHKIVGDQIGLHPLVTLISIYVGLKLIGFAGIIIAPIIVVIIKFLQKKELLPNWK